MSDPRQTQWYLKYRPATLDEMVLEDHHIAFFKKMIESQEPMSILLSGTAGIGKTTLAKALVNELDAEFLFLNCSGRDRGIDTVKNKITNFATTMSMDGKRKVIIADEADNLTQDAQMALRSVIEDVGRSTTFILTCNFPGKLIDALISRCHPVKLEVTEKNDIMVKMARRLVKILNEEKIEFTKPALSKIVKSNFPDFRKTLNDLQRQSYIGPIDEEAAKRIQLTSNDELINILKQKSYERLYQWLMLNAVDPESTVLNFWPRIAETFTAETQPYAVVHMNEAQFHMSMVADKHLTMVAAFTKMMADCEVKDV